MGIRRKIIVILGPTASGKSDLAVGLARQVAGEIVSADSRQVYKGMNIGTGKITRKEMRSVPHYCIDIASPKKVFSASDFVKCGREALEKIWGKGKVPIICGGTGFYINALLGEMPLADVPPNLKLRKKLAKKSAEELFKMLKRLDPARAKNIDAKNPRRLIRAIEIAMFRPTKIALSNSLTLPSLRSGARPHLEFEKQIFSGRSCLFFGIKLPDSDLKKRIEKRIKKMIKSGLLAETKKLHASGLSWKRVNELGFEYKYPAMFLRKEISKDEMLAKMLSENWKYVKRQMTWFKKYSPKARWIRPDINQANKIVKKFL